MTNNSNRRDFLKTAAMGSIGLCLTNDTPLYGNFKRVERGKRAGIIGLDTSHVTAFTKTLNDLSSGTEYGEYKVVAAYPTQGSSDMPYSIGRLAGFTEQLSKMGVEIVDSINALLEKVDVVFLESVDGRTHLEQAIPVIKAGKRMFIDKPIANSLADAMAIFEVSEKYQVPVFSSSATRFAPSVRDLLEGKTPVGTIMGADTFSPTGLAPGHPDMFFYGIHGIESLFTVMGPGCKSVVRFNTAGTDVLVGTWADGRVGTFRGVQNGFGGKVFGSQSIMEIGDFAGYKPMLVQIIAYFNTGQVPVTPRETLEILAFMEAADESKRQGGTSVDLEAIIDRAATNRKNYPSIS